MNARQIKLLVTGVFLIALIVAFKPIRQQNPFYFPVIESMADLSQQRTSGHLSAADAEKNYIAAGFVLIATLFGAYAFRDKHPSASPVS